MDRYTRHVHQCLDAALPATTRSPEKLHDAMRYAVLNGGKRVRPLLVYAAGECLSVDSNLLDGPAVAIELIHAFSLVHDDLPCFDDAATRRGKPSVHTTFGETTAVLAGDAMIVLAFETVAAEAESGDLTRRRPGRTVTSMMPTNSNRPPITFSISPMWRFILFISVIERFRNIAASRNGTPRPAA